MAQVSSKVAAMASPRVAFAVAQNERWQTQLKLCLDNAPPPPSLVIAFTIPVRLPRHASEGLMARTTWSGLLPLAAAILVFGVTPEDASAQDCRWLCHEGNCRMEYPGAWTGCKIGCDFRDYESCDPEGLTLQTGETEGVFAQYDGFTVEGAWVDPETFVSRNCQGGIQSVHYTPEAVTRREQIARLIVMTEPKRARVLLRSAQVTTVPIR